MFEVFFVYIISPFTQRKSEQIKAYSCKVNCCKVFLRSHYDQPFQSQGPTTVPLSHFFGFLSVPLRSWFSVSSKVPGLAFPVFVGSHQGPTKFPVFRFLQGPASVPLGSRFSGMPLSINLQMNLQVMLFPVSLA